MQILSVQDPAFKPYGKLLEGYDTEALRAAMERIRELTAETAWESPYDLIGPLMEQAELRFRSAQ